MMKIVTPRVVIHPMKEFDKEQVKLDISRALDEFDMSHIDFGTDKQEIDIGECKMGWDKLSSIVKPYVEKSKFWQTVLKFKKEKLDYYNELKGQKKVGRRSSIRKSLLKAQRRKLTPAPSKTFKSSEKDDSSHRGISFNFD